jgi:hypothetical protein
MKVFVGGLSLSTTKETLREAFTSLDLPVLDADVLRDPDSERSRGFGFVEFNRKWTECKFGEHVEVDFNLADHFWKGCNPEEGKSLRIDGVDCGVYAYRTKSKGLS